MFQIAEYGLFYFQIKLIVTFLKYLTFWTGLLKK